jgi:hypothetical protein
MPRRFQFSLWNLLAAMVWLSVCGASYSIIWGLDNYRAEGFPNWLLEYMAVSNYMLTVSSPFIAVGVLFDRGRAGAIVAGLVVVVLSIGWLSN